MCINHVNYTLKYFSNMAYKNECIESLKENNPEFKHYLFDDNDCRDFIKSNFGQDVVNAFDTLEPGAYKADLWRYCVLYKSGGVYLDVKYNTCNGFKLIDLVNEQHFCLDNDKIYVYNAFMICKPENDILLKCIHKIVDNVRNQYYGANCLAITGPQMMLEFFTEDDRKRLRKVFFTDDNGNFYISYNERPILLAYPEYRMEQRMFQIKPHYGQYWNARKVYNV
jgi:mannosyltransferase OCH1-like enzyme